MEKQKKWQFGLIVAVLGLTLYNILPTIFYYSKPLDKAVNQEMASHVVDSTIDRVDSLQDEGLKWIYSFNDLLGVKAQSVEAKEGDVGEYMVTFSSAQDAARFKRFLPRAGRLIPFVPGQLQLGYSANASQNEVVVVRNIGVNLAKSGAQDWFTFSPLQIEGAPAPLYVEWVQDRLIPLISAMTSDNALNAEATFVANAPADLNVDESLMRLAGEINGVVKGLGVSNPLTKSLLFRVSQGDSEVISALQKRAESAISSIEQKINTSTGQAGSADEKSISSRESVALLTQNLNELKSFTKLLSDQKALFTAQAVAMTPQQIQELVIQKATPGSEQEQSIPLSGASPFFDALFVDWEMGSIDFVLKPEISEIVLKEPKSETAARLKDQVGQLLINEVAYLSRISDEEIKVDGDQVSVRISPLLDTTGILKWDLGELAKRKGEEILGSLKSSWSPTHTDLQPQNFPILDQDSFSKLSALEQKIGLVLYTPATQAQEPPKGFRSSSIYLIAKGLRTLIKQAEQNPAVSNDLMQDMQALTQSLQAQGFIAYPGSSYGMDPIYKDDIIFELSDYYGMMLSATREKFEAKGSKRFAILPFSNVEQRLLTENQIGDQIQEDLLKWREAYNAAQVDLNLLERYSVPKPTKSPFIENIKLSAEKYLRGDERKVLNWGLDLSGGKAVRIGLVDHSGKAVTNPEDLRQAVDELYQRVNKLGVSERTIRIEDQNIHLEFPGSQGLSATELVKASSMTFHIVNEKFSRTNERLADPVNRFLQEVWNEAVVTNQKDIESINRIAWQKLGGDPSEESAGMPRGEFAELLYNSGLRLVSPEDRARSSTFNDTFSMVARLKGEDHSEWHGETHPLMFVFSNYAAEGSSLTNVNVGYDQTEGNMLQFDIKSSYDQKGRVGNPRDELYAWTSTFSEESVQGTPLENYSKGHGWRMAVLLNDQVISAPSLKGPLKDRASITGRFSQREISQLAADLRAGSLSFTPRILSENNISPDLGKEERAKGISASLIALALVVVVMTGYYRFAGVVASIAVLLNLLIMWGVLQNIDAALTLAGIAGIVLTIGMAVDANVLVFERIKEEFAISGRIASAIQTGYRKAFSAIVDSNITTIIAALILIQFDSGPIKGFAVTLIIGIISSMFTALFMTRYFFAGWVKRGGKKLSMSNLISGTKIDFLSKTRFVVILSILVIAFGGTLFVKESSTIFGMDFTGGYALTVEVEEKGEEAPRIAAHKALVESGAPALDVQVRQLTHPNQLRIQLGMGMEESSYPFYEMPREIKVPGATYEYETNPRLTWVVNALAAHGVEVQASELPNLSSNWSVVSGQFSDVMRNQAAFALLLAMVAILIYITLRFQFKYAISAVIGLVHDVMLTLGVMAIFHYLGFPVQIDLVVVGAIMTIIGYSLNDTIIVFDRIREDTKLMRKSSFREVVNHSINITLSRTAMTSGTTLLVLVSLLLLGGPSIFAFSLVMTMGVLFGTASSLYVAPAALLYFHGKEHKNGSKGSLKLRNAS